MIAVAGGKEKKALLRLKREPATKQTNENRRKRTRIDNPNIAITRVGRNRKQDIL